MVFNHYAKLKRIIDSLEPGWYILRIEEPTTAQNFRGDKVVFDHYYRVFSKNGEQVKYGKFQQLDRLSSVLDLPVESLDIRTSN